MSEKKEPAEKASMIAKRDHHVCYGSWDKEKKKHEHDYDVKKGDDVSKLPGPALAALKTEKVI